MSTTALYQALIEAGTPKETAEKAVEGLLPAGEVATKTDLAELKTNTGRLETELRSTATKADMAELKTDMAELKTELKTDMAEMENRLIRWLITTAAVVIAAVGLIVKL